MRPFVIVFLILSAVAARAATDAVRFPRDLPSGRSDGRPALPPRDLKTMARLTKEFSCELSALGVRTSALEEKLEEQRTDLEAVKGRIERLSERVREPDRFHYSSGEVRVVGFDRPELSSFSNLILKFDYSVSEKISGIFSPQLTLLFDRARIENVGAWEAYVDFDELGPIERMRVGRHLVTMGAGLTLCDRLEAFDITCEYADVLMQVILPSDLILLAEVEAPLGQRLGFYYLEESKNAFGLCPIHIGAYLKGPIGQKISLGLEYANYSNRVFTVANHDRYTEGYLADLRYQPSKSFTTRLSFVAEEEDFRALSIDRDLSYHSPVWSPLEDVLQAISSASRMAGIPGDRSEINGFMDFKAGLDFKLPKSRFWVGLDVDHLRNYSHLFDNTGNEFTVYGARLKLSFAGASWAELRGRYVKFDQPDPYARAGTLDIPRVDFTEVRLQWFTPF